jgi:hypothetical protein
LTIVRTRIILLGCTARKAATTVSADVAGDRNPIAVAASILDYCLRGRLDVRHR